MFKVFAENIKVYKKAGFYPEELLVANEFWVTVTLNFNKQPDIFQDYEMLINIVYETAQKDFTLLEDWASLIISKLKQDFKFQYGCLSIKKCNPSIVKAEVAAVGIELEF
jgi:dihydroneopterin aldolase